MRAERLIRITRWPADRELPIYSGEPLLPLPASWIAISEVPESLPEDDSYCMYVIDDVGEIHECLQWETLEIAIDQGRWILGIEKWAWIECSVLVQDGPFDVAALERVTAAR